MAVIAEVHWIPLSRRETLVVGLPTSDFNLAKAHDDLKRLMTGTSRDLLAQVGEYDQVFPPKQ